MFLLQDSLLPEKCGERIYGGPTVSVSKRADLLKEKEGHSPLGVALRRKAESLRRFRFGSAAPAEILSTQYATESI